LARILLKKYVYSKANKFGSGNRVLPRNQLANTTCEFFTGDILKGVKPNNRLIVISLRNLSEKPKETYL